MRKLFVAALVLAGSPLLGGRQADPPASIVPVKITGDAASRFTLVVLADGYTAADMPKFRQHLDKHLNILWSLEPFRSYRNYFNVYAVESISEESGITCDPEVRLQRKTIFGTSFGGGCTNINARGVTVPNALQSKVRDYASRAAANPDQILIIANSETYGGIGGGYATSTGGNALSPLITPHEIGHSLGRLTDEYTYSQRGVAGGTYAGGEPNNIHTTIMTADEMKAKQLKWWRWLGEPSEAGGVIGAFEGGSGNTKGIWRPSKHSMMISLGYFYDQVSREQMVRQISSRVGLIAASTPAEQPVERNDVLWIHPAHPVYHELTVTWKAGDRVLANPSNAPVLDLAKAGLTASDQTVSVSVVDPTDFVRDPVIRNTVLTASKSWTLKPGPAAPARAGGEAPYEFSASTQTTRPIGGSDVVYVEMKRHGANMPAIVWRLDGQTLADGANRFSLALGSRKIAAGTHTLTASLGTGAPSRTWTIDNTPPTAAFTLGNATAGAPGPDGEPQYTARGEFAMKLEPKDDHPGYVVAEFRVDGDGWHHYYGWPDAPPGTPFKFTPRGTNIKELIYGSLSKEGLSPQPWEPREPGFGAHRIEYRAKDAAGNIGPVKAFRVTVTPAGSVLATK